MTKEELENIAKDRFKEKPIGYEHNFELKIYQDGFAEGYEYCQASTALTDNTETLENALKRIAELEKSNENFATQSMILIQRNAELKGWANTIIQDLLDNSDEYARQRAMDFLEEKE